MTKRIILTGVLAGIGMFVWSSIAHMALPLGATGVQTVPNEHMLLAPMQNTLGGASGLYLFPAMGTGSNEQKMQEYDSKLATNPHGLLVYHPSGDRLMIPRQLGTEFLAELIEAMLAVVLLAQCNLTSFAGRVGFVAGIGLIAAITTNISYWNWYGFPSSYTAAYMFTQFMGFVVAGLIAAAMIKGVPRARSAAA